MTERRARLVWGSLAVFELLVIWVVMTGSLPTLHKYLLAGVLLLASAKNLWFAYEPVPIPSVTVKLPWN